MPRTKTGDAAEPKKRSRTGCWPCKSRKVKCGEEKPACANCVKQGEVCDYSIRLQWGGRSKKDQDAFAARAYPTSTNSTPTQTPRPSVPSFAVMPSPSWQAGPKPPIPSTASGAHLFMLDPQLMVDNQGRHSPYTSQSTSHSIPAHTQPPFNGNQRSSQYALPPPDFNWSEQHRAKRVKLSPRQNGRNTLPSLTESMMSNASFHDQPSPSSARFTPFSLNSNVNSPGTPSSSIGSDDMSARPVPTSYPANRHQPPELRRLSVNSLLSAPPEDYEAQPSHTSNPSHYPKTDAEGSTIYGYDYGYPDLDVSRNNDAIAIIPQSPASCRSGMSPDAIEAPSPVPSKEAAFQRGCYYAQPVPIRISKEFEPLPSYLTDSPMNLLYFHHFLNHTARVLTPHDCPDNPLRTILPKMAMHNPDLLNLLFAYSASHRARLLSHPEPKDRIAFWVRDVFPNLRHALSSQEPVSDATLATAIMLASREIITPNTFEVNIPWQNHLGIARQMIIQRGGLKDMGEKGSPVVNFLARWFAYLDVIGSLSGHKNDIPLSEAYWSFPHDTISRESKSSMEGDEHGFAIDCFFGFTNCCISLLARVAKLAHECDEERIDADRNVDPNWAPSDETREAAERLAVELTESRGHVHAGCRHSDDSGHSDWGAASDSTNLDLQEIVNVNEAFHLAGLIHLYRRVMGRASEDKEVQECVRQVLLVLSQIRKGGTAESCLLFPMFTAGCDAIDSEHRALILERLKLVEGLGMTHVTKARLLMEMSWKTSKPWETLASGEFFG